MSVERSTKAGPERDPRLLAYPYPYKAWLALSSDPDSTRIEDWKELDQLIWKELALPFADSLFLRSHNLLQPAQVDLFGHPEILAQHAHDTIHTWGDHMFSGKRGFDRSDAEEMLQWMEQLGYRPRVWVDHSLFVGNLLHNHQYGGIPEFRDASGYTYPNPLYTLDLIRKAGVRYFWDGTITAMLGQDRPLSLRQYHLERTGSGGRGTLDWVKHRVGDMLGVGTAFRKQFKGNAAYRVHEFPDGSKAYVFTRYGKWELADIQGLGELLSPRKQETLIGTGGVCIAYTHLGKRNASSAKDAQHIPPSTRKALEHMALHHAEQRLMLSPVSTLLDHLVLRDHLHLDGSVLHMRPDGIALTTVSAAEVAGQRFSFKGTAPKGLKVQGTEGLLEHSVEQHEGAFTVRFPGP